MTVAISPCARSIVKLRLSRMNPSCPWFTSSWGGALRKPQIGAVREVEVSRRNAGGRAVEFGEANRLADHVGIAVVEVLPQAQGNHDPGRWARLAWCAGRRGLDGGEVVVREAAPRQRQPEQLEESLAHRIDLHVRRGSVVADQREVARLKARRPLDGLLGIMQSEDLASGEQSGRDPSIGQRRAQAVELLRVGIGERF